MLLRSATALSGAVLALLPGPGSGPAQQTLPVAGDVSPAAVLFNDPLGSHARQYALIDRVDRAIDDAPSGSTIRVAEYSFAMPRTTEALIAAQRRGVAVQVVVDQHSAHWASVRRLAAAVGTDTSTASFVKVCHGSCRGVTGRQHAKFVTFSATGDRRDVVMTGSMNLTNFNARLQWNDLLTVADPTLFAQLADLFALMTLDLPQARLTLPPAGDGLDATVSPIPGARADAPMAGPVAGRLARVRCTGAEPGAGRVDGHTIVRIAMHAWNGSRGVALAHRVAGLAAAGCAVKVLYGIGMGGRVAKILRAAGVPTRNSLHNGRRTHEKVMILSGVFGTRTDANLVWTGSYNWSNRSLRNDEVILRAGGRGLVHAYLRNFHRMWTLARR